MQSGLDAATQGLRLSAANWRHFGGGVIRSAPTWNVVKLLGSCGLRPVLGAADLELTRQRHMVDERFGHQFPE
jgi:hypothetical protein